MIVTFVAGSRRHPVGGVLTIYEFANAFARRGYRVHLVHRPFWERLKGPDEITWSSFEPTVEHHFPESWDVAALPDADFVFLYDENLPDSAGQPLMFVQGTMVGRRWQERRMRETPCPKVCVAAWLVGLGRQLGIPSRQLVHVPYGLRHEKYRLVVPIEDRPAQVSMLYHKHPFKGAQDGLTALAIAKRRVPGMHAVVFGVAAPEHPLPDWIDYRRSPPQDVLVDEIYNRSCVFVSSSVEEGFGLPGLEAMACGCALAVTASGGSAEHAVHGQTALVSPARDAAALAAHIEELLLDSQQRTRLARGAVQRAKGFTWDRSAGLLERFLYEYAADPGRYQWAPANQ